VEASIWPQVEALLGEGWSPEQIVGSGRVVVSYEPSTSTSPTTVTGAAACGTCCADGSGGAVVAAHHGNGSASEYDGSLTVPRSPAHR